MSSVVFSLNRPNGVYFDNDTIEGIVTLRTTKPKNVRDMQINFNGRVKVLWDTDEYYHMNDVEYDTPRFIYRTAYPFIEDSLSVLTNDTLPPGTYDYSFSFETTSYCLTSCEGRYGHVRYELSLEIHRNDTYSNVFRHGVTVIRTFDFNIESKYWTSPVVTRSNESELPMCLCTLGTLYFTLKTPYWSYIPGQYISYTLQIHSKSSSKILQCSVQLIKKMVFLADEPCFRKFKIKNVLAQRVVREDNFNSNLIEDDLFIPPTPPTSHPMDIIYVKYYLQASVEITCCKMSKLVAKHEINIGTDPLIETLPTRVVMAMYNERSEMAASGNLIPLLNARRASFCVSDTLNLPFTDYDIPLIDSIPYYPLYPTYSKYNYRN